MAKRFTDTEIHGKAWHRKLPTKIKCLWQWLRDNCDHAGILEYDFELASFQIGEDVDWDSLKYFGDRVEKISDTKIWLTGFAEFQYTKLKEGYNPHKPVFASLEKFGLISRVEKIISRLPQGLRENSQALVDDAESLMDKDKDKDKGKAQDQDQEKEKEKVTYDFLRDEFNRLIAPKNNAIARAPDFLRRNLFNEFKELLTHEKLNTREAWSAFYQSISMNKVLTHGDEDDENPWIISFSWLLDAKNVDKVLSRAVGWKKSKSNSGRKKQESMIERYKNAMGAAS